MKNIIILFMLLFCASIANGLSTTIRYVDPAASGGGTGVDWANAYTSTNAALAAATKDLVSADLVWKLVCRSDSANKDTTKISTGDAFTVDATRHLWIYGDDFPADGVWDDNAYTIFNDDANGEQVDMREEHTVWENIQFEVKQTSTNTRHGMGIYVQAAGNLNTIKNCIFKGNCTSTGAAYGIQINDADANVNIYNTIVYDFESATDPHTDFRGINIVASTAVNIWNSTIEGCNIGINGVFTIKNSAVFNNADDFNGTPTADYNATDDDDDRGTNGVDLNENASGEWTASFTNYGTNTYSVKDASAPIYNVGTDDPGGAAQDGDDITGFARTSTWDIGAFEWDDSGSGDPGGQGSDSGGIKYGFKNGGGKDGGKQN